jgi:AcrR family transcriptional regulator
MARPADPHSRAALVAAARAEFARAGLRGARIEDITAACGLSKGAFYLHFESKEALFGELVGGFQAEIERCSVARRQTMDAFAREDGPLGPADVARRSRRFLRMLALERGLDLEMLEVMWTYRDVFGVLTGGSQGTPFERVVWTMTDAEVRRIASEFGDEQRKGACRTDVAPELFGSLIVGTYLLLAQRMIGLAGKPDLAAWAVGIQKLVREGSLPARALHPASGDASARPELHGRSTSSTPQSRRAGHRPLKPQDKRRKP